MISGTKVAAGRKTGGTKRLFIPWSEFQGVAQIAFTPAGSSANPTLTLTKAAGTAGTAPLLATDANGAALVNDTIAATRTGLTGIIAGAFTGTAIAEGDIFVSVGAGTPKVKEVSTFGVSGLRVNTAGDDVRHMMPVPQDWSRNHPIQVRMIWSSEAAAVGARTITWKFLYKLLIPGTTAIAAPSTALDTVIIAQAPLGTAFTLERSPAGILQPPGLGYNENAHIIFLCENDAFDAAFTENKVFHGVEFEYTPNYV